MKCQNRCRLKKNAFPEALNRLIYRPSCWYRLQKSVAWLLGFKQNFLSRCERSKIRSTMPFLKCQRKRTDSLINSENCSRRCIINKHLSRFSKLIPVFQDKIITAIGRLDKSPIPDESFFRHRIKSQSLSCVFIKRKKAKVLDCKETEWGKEYH